MKTLLVVSDPHINSAVGLSKPLIQLDDSNKIEASIPRRWLYQTYMDILSRTASMQRGDLISVINGDALELDAKDRSTQLLSRNPADVLRMAEETLEPLFAMSAGVYVIRGTEAHVGKSAQAEETLAGNFTNTIRNPETGSASWWHLMLELDGVRLDIAHHPRGGSGRPMTSQGTVDRLAVETLFTYANEGMPAPHLVIRSHLHGYRDSHNAFRTRAVITPALSLLTAHTHRIGINWSEPVGAILIFCDAGRYHVQPLLYPVRRPQWQTL